MVTVGASGEACGARALAACPPGPLCRLCGAAPQAPGGDCPDTASAGCRRRGDEDGNPVLALGQAAWSRVCSGSGHLSSATVWAEGALRPSVVPLWLPT